MALEAAGCEPKGNLEPAVKDEKDGASTAPPKDTTPRRTGASPTGRRDLEKSNLPERVICLKITNGTIARR
jgi:hypothetical protein